MAANTVLRFFSLFECIFIPNIRRKHLTFYPMWCIITLYNCRIMSEGGERNGQKQTDRRLRRLAAPSAHRIRADAGRHGARAGNLKKDPRRHRKRAFLSRLDRQCRSLPSFRRQRNVAPRPFVRSRAGSRRAALAFTACRPGISSDTGIASPPPAEGSSPLWRAVGQLGRFRAEQNVISEHYRLVDGSGRRVFASFDYSEITAAAERLETRGVQTKGDNGNDDEL